MTAVTVVERAEQPYVAKAAVVTMATMARVADLLPEVFGWLGERGIGWVDAPFFRYLLIDMDGELHVEVGVPVAALPRDADDRVRFAVLPGGRYAKVSHTGHPDELVGVTAELLAWAEREGRRWDMTATPDGERWGCRLEVYRTDPAVEPDMAKWETDLLFRLAG